MRTSKWKKRNTKLLTSFDNYGGITFIYLFLITKFFQAFPCFQGSLSWKCSLCTGQSVLLVLVSLCSLCMPIISMCTNLLNGTCRFLQIFFSLSNKFGVNKLTSHGTRGKQVNRFVWKNSKKSNVPNEQM